ncbi:MAG: outer membrane lipoprotein-sorting protein [Firmicutes bacterium]|nr:outer membrane lipoprotein-sorting protein [Bacillota bacterium]
MKRFFIATIFLVGALATGIPAQAVTPLEIMEKVDQQAYIGKARFEATLVMSSRGRDVVKEMVAVTEGSSRAFVEFTNARDRGTKYLKIDKELWMYFPDAEDIVKISGHMLRQGMMGSDVSYEEALESNRLVDSYDISLAGEEPVNGEQCYVLELKAKPGKNPAYATRKMWVSKEKYVSMKEQLFAQSGKMVKVATTEEVRQFGGRYLATKVVMDNLLKKDSKTVFIIKKIDFNPAITPETFSLKQLGKH